MLPKANIVDMVCILTFFFLKEESAIRDLTVTGVQTCALPILAFTPASRLLGGDSTLHARHPGPMEFDSRSATHGGGGVETVEPAVNWKPGQTRGCPGKVRFPTP